VTCNVGASMNSATVAAVLERLNVAAPSRDLAGLRSVYAAWCRGVSFDNVLKMIHVAEQRPGPLPGSTAESFFEDWLSCGAGGTCWAGNEALHGLLEALGFDARRAIATMMPSYYREPNHGSVVVSFEGDRWIADASILTAEPVRIPAPGEPVEPGPLPRFEWVDGRPAVIWRTLSAPDGFPCRIERIGADHAEWDALHRKSGVWSPFNFELSARVMRGTSTVGVSPGQRFTIAPDGSISATPQDYAARVRFLIEELGVSEDTARRLPHDRPVPPRPQSEAETVSPSSRGTSAA
jgi:N-hydroxyarylamine O-acetyltransferase